MRFLLLRQIARVLVVPCAWDRMRMGPASPPIRTSETVAVVPEPMESAARPHASSRLRYHRSLVEAADKTAYRFLGNMILPLVKSQDT